MMQRKKSLHFVEIRTIVDIETLQTVPGNCNKRIARKVSNHGSKKERAPRRKARYELIEEHLG